MKLASHVSLCECDCKCKCMYHIECLCACIYYYVHLCVNGSTTSLIAGQLLEGESLFTYPEGRTYLDYAHPDHIPVFPDEAIARATPEVLAACGTNVECIFDAVETGDISVGVETMTTIGANLDDEAQACK